MKTAPVKNRPTKRGVVSALRYLGFTENPPSLKGVSASLFCTFTAEEMEWARYIVADTDFGGAWNDAEQINLHLA